MKRNAINELLKWKDQNNRNPLILNGIKGVGKTYLALEFAKNFFEGYVYINFENNFNMRQIFKQEAAIKEHSFVEIISSSFEIPEELFDNILIVIDEFSFWEDADYFINQSFSVSEKNINILMISSNIDKPEFTFEYSTVTLYPMDFGEFLTAIGSKWYAEVIEGHFSNQKKVPGIVHDELLELFEDYMYVGGMPAAINEYIATDNLDNLSELHIRSKENMISFLAKCSSESDALKIKQVIDVVPAQLIKQNKKFQFNYIRKGVTHNLYNNAIKTLTDPGVLIKCNKINEDESSSYKLYLYDTASLKSLIESECLNDKNFEKIYYENYIAQVLHAKKKEFGFWESKGVAQLEFIVKEEGLDIPIEIKTPNSSKSKSLSIYSEKFHPPYSIKISQKNFEFIHGVKNIPYYATYCV